MRYLSLTVTSGSFHKATYPTRPRVAELKSPKIHSVYPPPPPDAPGTASGGILPREIENNYLPRVYYGDSKIVNNRVTKEKISENEASLAGYWAVGLSRLGS